MQIDAIDRTVTISVREFATFRQPTASDSSSGFAPWRAAVGQEWHKVAESATREQFPEAQFEYTLRVHWQHQDWRITFQGRIDQIIPKHHAICLREVKSVRTGIPQDTDILLDTYPDYFAQIATYKRLASVLPDFENQSLYAELYLIQIENGAVQSIELGPDEEALFDRQLDKLTRFLDDRLRCRRQFAGAQLQPAFATLRDGQPALIDSLIDASLRSKNVLLEAPTGFGKTGIVLEHALKQMQSGQFERCIYLTTKSTGQIETIRQLEHIVGGNLRYLQMRNRHEHAIESPQHNCQEDRHCAESLSLNWDPYVLAPENLFENNTLSLLRAKAIGEASGICPYELSLSALPYADVWIGDVNYVFAPDSQDVFLEAHGFNPEKTLLIVDEAHNLPDRAASSLSVELTGGDFLFALEELRAAGAPRRLVAIGQEICRFIESQKEGNPLDTNAIYEALDLCEDFTKQLRLAQFDYDALAPFAMELIWRIPRLAERLDGTPHEWLHWIDHGTLKATCLDASDWIQQMLHPFGSCILMSATLSPIDAYAKSCGYRQQPPAYAQGHATWRDTAYTCAIDLRVDTRLRVRDQYYEATARTVAQLIHSSPGEPIAVFFASYQYAENIQNYLEAMHPEYRVMQQPRGVDLAEQEAFIESGLLLSDALFLILGSSYAEGVDQLGGRIRTVMIVGPALPEVNAIQNAKMESHPSLKRTDAFTDVYIRPAMRRIHQALGRIVRAPEHSAKVLLHDRRFQDPEYYTQLAPEYQNADIIRSDDEFIHWIQKSPQAESPADFEK